MHERVCIFIPSYNTRDFLRPTVRRIPWNRLPVDLAFEVLFIDNASADGTPDQIRAACSELEAGGVQAHAVFHRVNRGYGGSLKEAFGFCLEHGFDFMVVLHADGQYAPEALPGLLAKLLEEPRATLHFGSRLASDPLEGGMPTYKFLANHVLSKIQNLCTGLSLSEYHSGYRLYRLAHLRHLPWPRLSDEFVVDNEVIFMIGLSDGLITESPIPTHYGTEKSNVPRIGTPLAILLNMLEYLLARWGLRRDLRYCFDGRGRWVASRHRS